MEINICHRTPPPRMHLRLPPLLVPLLALSIDGRIRHERRKEVGFTFVSAPETGGERLSIIKGRVFIFQGSSG